MSLYTELRTKVIGAPLDPLSKETRHNIALVAFFAWVGLGADGISSSNYGPEQSFRALGEHTDLGLYLALATAVTVFIIALAYNQVIELFPTGGGGYRVATKLIGPYAGLASGAALVLDYVLTIAISIASGVDALFSLLPLAFQEHKLAAGIGLISLLIALNLRGMKEVIKVLLPIFLGFILTHAFLIIYGIGAHANYLPQLIPATLRETSSLAGQLGWAQVAALMLLAYSQGGGTYTGLEAVSNNVNVLAEPRVRTGKITMLYMALSLAFTAGGIILLYLLWEAKPVEGQTLNAVVFGSVIQSLGWDPWVNKTALWTVLALEGGLLFVAANTGFLGGPAVLSNMAADSWVPHKFRYLSTRLVTENGILVMGLAALGILIWTGGSVSLLVILYSVSVFLTFAISLFGLCVYWWRHRGEQGKWIARLALSAAGFLVCSVILVMLLVEKFAEGGWLTALIIAAIIGICLTIRNHYSWAKVQIRKVDEIFANQPFGSVADPPKPDPSLPTAVFLVGSSRGGGLHALLWVQRMFPHHFRNFIFVNARTVDAHSYGGSEDMKLMQMEANVALTYFVNFCNSKGWAAKSYLAFGTDPIDEAAKLADQVREEFPNCIFFASKLVFEHENWLIRLLHNEAALSIQRRLHLHGMQMVILPMKI
ncbi:MAG: amino acid transporter [Betaproteobacteria bacterium RIFCSPLOWO2_12_FULL_64_23]|nr:MAG: amino acid transporter [Betaproteobacteria bacterium RIFCSPLOWO2_12_FULL_64_23]